MSERIDPFGDLGDFAPAASAPKPVAKEVIDQVAADNNFPSRQPGGMPAPREQRRRRTGRNQQLNIKATAETVERFYRLADVYDVPLGELLDRALDALEQGAIE